MDLEATPEERLQLEYATQHFNFTPDSFVETITTTVIDSINDGLDETKKQLYNTFKKKVSSKEMDESFALVKHKYTMSAEKVLDNFSRYVKKNILIVPKNVVLPEDEVHVPKQAKTDSEISSGENTTIFNKTPAESLMNETEIPNSEFYNGDSLTESIKGYERQCENIQNSKYKEAILRAKLANLEVVAIRQRKLLKEAEELADVSHRLEDLVGKQEEVLEKKLNTLRELQTNLLPDIERGNTNSPEKRKLENALYEDAVMQKKCRQIEDGYDLIDTENHESI